MNRDVIMKIIGALPDEKLFEALSVIGLKPADIGFDPVAGMSMEGGAGDGSKITSWNARTVPYKGGGDRPTISDKEWALDSQEVLPSDGMGVFEQEQNPYLQTGGT